MPDTLVTPSHLWVPPYASTNGDIAADVGVQLGWTPDGNQRAILDALYAENEPGIPACFSVTCVAPRQNIKSSTYIIAALTDLFVFGEQRVIWTAHKYDTALDAFAKMVALIEANDDFRKRCKRPTYARGDEKIELLTGEAIEFHARSEGAGRGLDADRIVMDEALFLTGGHTGALLPVLATRPAAQVRYGSSAGGLKSAVLRGLRDRGRQGGHSRSAYFEWGSERRPCESEDCAHRLDAAGCALDDRSLWRQANPALGLRISEERLEDYRQEFSATPIEFAREFLGWWEDPPSGGGALDVEMWATLVDEPPPLRLPAFGVDLDEAGIGYFAVAWRRPDGLIQVQLAGLSTASKLQERADELKAKHKGRLYAGGPAAKLLKNADVVSMDEFAAACARLDDVFTSLRHCDEPELNDSVAVAKWRTINAQGARAWQLKDNPGIGPLAAVTRALHGLLTRGAGKGRALVLK